jgi:hypothetical protein
LAGILAAFAAALISALLAVDGVDAGAFLAAALACTASLPDILVALAALACVFSVGFAWGPFAGAVFAGAVFAGAVFAGAVAVFEDAFAGAADLLLADFLALDIDLSFVPGTRPGRTPAMFFSYGERNPPGSSFVDLKSHPRPRTSSKWLWGLKRPSRTRVSGEKGLSEPGQTRPI